METTRMKTRQTALFEAWRPRRWKTPPARLAPGLSGLLAGALAACAGDPETQVDLKLVETIPVEFGAMEGGVSEGVVVSLGDLSNEPAWVEAREHLACVSVDRENSAIVIDALDVGQFATPLTWSVGVGPRGAASFQPLATFSGAISEGQRVRFADGSFQVQAAGLDAIETQLLGASPALDLQIQGQVPGAIEDLVVTLSLALQFSSDPADCQ
jgi:hypothetical protein